jgi:hypothetical protein
VNPVVPVLWVLVLVIVSLVPPVVLSLKLGGSRTYCRVMVSYVVLDLRLNWEPKPRGWTHGYGTRRCPGKGGDLRVVMYVQRAHVLEPTLLKVPSHYSYIRFMIVPWYHISS